MLHPSIRLEYQQSDLSSTLPTKATVSTYSRLSTGAEAGIGVGCTLFLILLTGAIALFLRRRHRNHFNSSEPAPGPEAKHGVLEKDGDARAELVASKLYPSHELKGSSPDETARAELEASKLYPSHELSGAILQRDVKLDGDGAGSEGRGQPNDNVDVEERRNEVDHIENLSAPSSQLTQSLATSGTNRSALAARELDWLEQEERKIRERKAWILAQAQQ